MQRMFLSPQVGACCMLVAPGCGVANSVGADSAGNSENDAASHHLQALGYSEM